jgi:hypothetical protein
MVESLMQQIQSAMNGGKKYVRKPVRSASPVKRKPVRSAAKPVKRRVFPKMRRSVGGFFEELNEMFANNAKEEEKEKNGGIITSMKPPTLSDMSRMVANGATGANGANGATGATGASGMAGGRFRVYKKKVLVKKAMTGVKKAAKPKRRMTYGGYEDDEVEMQEEEVQEGGRRRVFKKAPKKVVKPKRRPASRGRMSYGGNEEVEAQEGGRLYRPRRPRSASPARRPRARRVNH